MNLSATKVFLTAVIGAAFLLIFLHVAQVHRSFLQTEQQKQHPPAVFVGQPPAPPAQNSGTRRFWPEFPRTSPRNLRSTILNGVEVLNEEWRSGAQPGEILAYYRNQMAARGWEDTTEVAYGFDPKMRPRDSSKNGLQDPRFLENYRKIMDSNLVLSRGEWSLHIATESAQKPGETFVRICAAATPSLKEFFLALSGGLTASGIEGKDRPIDAVQFSGGQRYHTTISLKPQPPALAFEQAMAERRGEGWKPVMSLPTGKSRAQQFVWLTRGQDYAALAVKPTADGRGASLAFTEVTSQ